MNTRFSLVASTLVLVATFAGTASANLSTGNLGVDVQSAVSAGHVSVQLKEGVATLFGGVDNQTDANAAIAAATQFEGVDQVISNIYVSN